MNIIIRNCFIRFGATVELVRSMGDDSDRPNIGDMARRLEAAMSSGSDSMANGILNELDSDYETLVKKARTSIVEFYRESCPYCRQMMAALEELAEKYKSKVFFGKVNIETVDGVVDRFNISGVPLTVAFKKGMPVSRMDGFKNFEAVESWIEMLYRGVRPGEIPGGQVSTLE